MSSTALSPVGEESIRNTNIEVCVRVRPLAISNDKKFFETRTTNAGGGRVRHPSRLSRPGTSIRRTSTQQPRKQPAPESSQKLAALDDVRPAWDVIPPDTIQQSPSTTILQGRTSCYTLDRVYGPASNTSELFENSFRSLVEAAMDGYHASVFAYGQTSTGKTFTMTGTKESPGIVPLAVEDCFRLIETLDSPREYLLRVSYMEIYNEQTIDLLTANPQPVRIFESKNGEVSIRGLTEEVVSSPAQVFSLICEGETRRQVGSTNMNKHSSRSHTIFRIWIESRSSEYEHSNVRISSLSLVDLAGSESIRLSGSTGERRKEGQYINKSLMALGQVVYKLSELKRQGESPQKVHIPYRDSKLTRLLQPSLSGNAQIVIICNVSPQASHLEESHNTLKFAVRAKRIQQKAIRTEVIDEKTLLQSYRQEIQDLKDQLRQAQEAQKLLESQNALGASIGDDDTRELVEAIQKMERLILKTKTPPHPIQSAENLALAASSELTDLLSLEESPVTPPRRPEQNEDLVDELHRIQVLLSTVLVKRSIFSTPGGKSPSPQRDKEVEELRAQLYQKDITTSLRKADSSFLQSQLAEKDVLLAEVSNILEAVEKRQIELETENTSLREKLARSEENLSITRRSQEGLQRRLEKLQDTLVDRDAGLSFNGGHLNR
jgi:centromeric protein E